MFVDDGSTDATPSILAREALKDQRVKLLRFSRNFGHQAAVTAGLDFANGDAVVVMDADLQDPPELLPRMLELFRTGLRHRVAAAHFARRRNAVQALDGEALLSEFCRAWRTSR